MTPAFQIPPLGRVVGGGGWGWLKWLSYCMADLWSPLKDVLFSKNYSLPHLRLFNIANIIVLLPCHKVGVPCKGSHTAEVTTHAPETLATCHIPQLEGVHGRVRNSIEKALNLALLLCPNGAPVSHMQFFPCNFIYKMLHCPIVFELLFSTVQ